MRELFKAFKNGYKGFSMWDAGERGVQCSLSKRGGFVVGYGDTPEDAWDAAWANTKLRDAYERDIANRTRAEQKPRRDMGDLL